MSTLRPLSPDLLKDPLDPFKLRKKLEELFLDATPRIFKAPALKISTAWEYKSAGSTSMSVGMAGISGGQIVLEESSTKIHHSFNYGGYGPAIGWGFKIPRLGKIEIPTPRGPVNATDSHPYPSNGVVFAKENLPGGDLTLSDIKGLCLFIEAGGGVIRGGSATALCIGLDPWLLPITTTIVFNPIAISILINSMKGVIYMAGRNEGIQGGVSGGGFLGWLD